MVMVVVGERKQTCLAIGEELGHRARKQVRRDVHIYYVRVSLATT